jgi:gluconolactonase
MVLHCTSAYCGPIGEVHRYSDRLDALISPGTRIEKLTEDVFDWSEGPVWIQQGNYLVFSDVPRNTAWKWSETGGLEVFMQPSSYGVEPAGDNGGGSNGGGSNGLLMSLDGMLMVADHGSRSLFSVDLRSRSKTLLVNHFDGKRFNSPNDLAVSRKRWPGAVFFTDPPYGLKGQDDSPLKELDFNGIYRLDTSGQVELLDKSMGRPNGIGLSPDEKTLYVANSQKHHSVWMAFDLDDLGGVKGEPRLFATAQAQADEGGRGLPDGLAVDVEGNVWASGPGGIFVFDSNGELLGLIETGTAAANCAFGGEKGNTLYITSHGFLARVQTLSRGIEFDRTD